MKNFARLRFIRNDLLELTESLAKFGVQKKISDDEKQKKKISDATNKLAAEAAAVF